MAVSKKVRLCKDCAALPLADQPKIPRPAPHAGPRCYTCHIARRNANRVKSHEKRVMKIYGLLPGDYQRLYELQGGKCYICWRATGKTKKLAVDHNHNCDQGHPPETACSKCVYGLLCGPCNKDVIGHLRRDIAALQRAIEYLENPPARALYLVS